MKLDNSTFKGKPYSFELVIVQVMEAISFMKLVLQRVNETVYSQLEPSRWLIEGWEKWNGDRIAGKKGNYYNTSLPALVGNSLKASYCPMLLENKSYIICTNDSLLI